MEQYVCMGVKSTYKSLPKQTKKLLNVGIILALLVALPLFVWSVVNMTFDLREKAQQQITIDLTNEPFLGYEDSPVTIVMYSDFQCEFCKSFIDNTLSTILSTYPNEVKFVHKDFPITTSHPLAQTAALAGQCAYNQNKFWEMHSLIFENQGTLDETSFTQFATTLNLDLSLFDNCMQDQTTLDEINADVTEGTTLGVIGTPTFFINNIKVDGAQSFEVFNAVIQQELLPSPTPTISATETATSSASISPTPTSTGSITPMATATTVATSTASPTITITPTATPTATPTSAPEEPNSCGGTCGSNYNCKANLYCYQGYCRNPICSEATDCNCASVTATPTTKATTKSSSNITTTNKTATPKSSPKSTPNYTGGMTLVEKPSDLVRDEEGNQTAEPENMFINKYAIYIVSGFGLIVVATIIYALKKKRDNNIPHIVPPTNI